MLLGSFLVKKYVNEVQLLRSPAYLHNTNTLEIESLSQFIQIEDFAKQPTKLLKEFDIYTTVLIDQDISITTALENLGLNKIQKYFI